LTMEAADALRECADELRLPDATLGHLFWFLWYVSKTAQSDRTGLREASFTRKLAYYAMRLDFSRIRKDSRGLVDHLADGIQITIDDCIKACIFRDVPALLAKAGDLMHNDMPKPVALHRQQKLIRQCWQAYWILGSADALSVMLDVFDVSGHPIGSAMRTSVPSGILEDFFCEAMPVLPGRQDVLQAAVERNFGGRGEASEAISDHAKGQASLLAFAAGPLLNLSGVGTLLRALVESCASLDVLHDSVWRRISAGSYVQAEILDIVTLSSTMWCAALRCNYALFQNVTCSGGNQLAVDNMWREIGHDRTEVLGSFGTKHFLKVIDMAENAVLVADQLRGLEIRPASRGAINFPIAGLARELCCVSAASITVAYYHYRVLYKSFNPELREDELIRITNLIEEINRILGASLPIIKTEEDLASIAIYDELDDLMRACEIMWHTFEIDRLGDFMSLRRAHLTGIRVRTNNEDRSSYRKFVESLETVNDQGFTGLLANLMIADNLAGTAELSAHYVNNASRIALRGNFGIGLTRDLALLAVSSCHNLSYDLSDSLACIFGDNTTIETTSVTELLAGFADEVVLDKIL
jgi:hypothetical protein